MLCSTRASSLSNSSIGLGTKAPNEERVEVGVMAPALNDDMLDAGLDEDICGALKLEGGDFAPVWLSNWFAGLSHAVPKCGVVIDTDLAPSKNGLLVSLAGRAVGSGVLNPRYNALDASFASSSCWLGKAGTGGASACDLYIRPLMHRLPLRGGEGEARPTGMYDCCSDTDRPSELIGAAHDVPGLTR